MDVSGGKKIRVSGWGLLKGVWKAMDLGVEEGGGGVASTFYTQSLDTIVIQAMKLNMLS